MMCVQHIQKHNRPTYAISHKWQWHIVITSQYKAFIMTQSNKISSITVSYIRRFIYRKVRYVTLYCSTKVQTSQKSKQCLFTYINLKVPINCTYMEKLFNVSGVTLQTTCNNIRPANKWGGVLVWRGYRFTLSGHWASVTNSSGECSHICARLQTLSRLL